MLWFLFLVFAVSAFISLLLMAATSPVSLEEVSHMASVEKLKATRRRGGSRDDHLLSETFEIWGLLFSCTYTRTYVHCDTDALCETIKVTVLSEKGFLKASFWGEELVDWEDGRNLHNGSDLHEAWLFKHLLATVKNAVATSRVDLSEREAIS